MFGNTQTLENRQRPVTAGIAVVEKEDKGGDQVMQLAHFMQDRTNTGKRRHPNRNIPIEPGSKAGNTKSVTLDMTLHVPCHVAGRTANGSRWKGKTRTISMSLSRAHLLLPEDVDLKGEIVIIFHIPSVLKVLFTRDIFRVKAEVRPSDLDGHWPAPSGQKIVDIVFSHPLKFATWAA